MHKMKAKETARIVMLVIPTARLTTADAQRAALVANLNERAQVKAWALALHDQDDPAAGGSGASGPHWQVVLQTAKDLPAARFESWFPHCEPVRKIEGGGDGLLDAVLYLTHENHPEKAQYPRSSIVASPGWDWEAELRSREVKAAGRSGGKGRTKVMAGVLDGHLSAMEARRRGVSNERAVRIARHQYLAGLGSEDLPPVRVNFYLELPSTQHPSGLRLAEALARTLSTDRRMFRMLGSNVDDYDGEEVLLMSSSLASWGMSIEGVTTWHHPGPLGGVREMLAVLGATPAPHTLSTKFGPTQLIHRHTVIIGTEPFDRFRAELEQGYENAIASDAREQSFLSLPVFVPVSADEFSIQASSRFALGRGELDQFVEVERVRLRIAEALGHARHIDRENRAHVVRELEQRQTDPIRAVGIRISDQMVGSKAHTADEVLAEFADLGQPITTVERTAS